MKQRQSVCKFDSIGNERWFALDAINPYRYHRENDLPAVTNLNGDQEWWEDGLLHRVGDNPAIIRKSGQKEWRKRGERHRDGDKPAVIWPDGTLGWWVNGERHRPGGSPAVVCPNGSREWWENGVRHRWGGGPAVIVFGSWEEYWVEGSYLEGRRLEEFLVAFGDSTPAQTLSALTHHEDGVIARAAAANPKCPLEDRVEWALMRGMGVE